MMTLSILIPSRNEQFLARTVEDILANAEGDTEVICVLDGAWANPAIPQHPRVKVVYHPESIGQRAATNEAARLSKAKYVMKVDAHCAFDKGFDVKMMAEMQDNWTMVPIMRNLHVFDWLCKSGHRRYQGPSGPCTECGKPTRQDVVWIAKSSPQSTAYCFDSTPHFQYHNEFKKRPEGQGELTETMSLQGSCFMVTRDKYWELELCDESFGSWGSQGIEVAVKTWLSGGRVVCNHKTWYAHMFRTQGGDFGFPYPQSGKQVEHAKSTARNLFFENKWPKQILSLSWLVEKFWPVPGWTDEDLAKLKAAPVFRPTAKPTKGVLYYTDNRLDPDLMTLCQERLKASTNGHHVVSVSLKPLEFGENIVLDRERGYLTMFEQILAGLEALDTDIIFFCEHDVLYAPGYFDFTPPDRNKVFYNLNVWQYRVSDGHAVYYDAKRTSQLCGYRDVLIEHYRKRVEIVKRQGFSRRMGFEPGSHNRAERVDDLKSATWVAERPNVDIKHGNNLTEARWSPEQFRDQRNCQNWQEADELPYWGRLGVLACR